MEENVQESAMDARVAQSTQLLRNVGCSQIIAALFETCLHIYTSPGNPQIYLEANFNKSLTLLSMRGPDDRRN